MMKIFYLPFLAILLLTACNGTPPAAKTTASSTTATGSATTTVLSASQGLENVTLELEGYGYKIGDIVSVDRNAKPAIGNVVYYDSMKNKDYCTSFGPGGRLAKISGNQGDSVIFTSQSFEINGQTYDLGRTRVSGKLMWGNVRYDSIPIVVLNVPQGEYMADSWLGFECPGETDQDGNSVLYNRYTVKKDSVIGVVTGLVSHDDNAERVIKNSGLKAGVLLSKQAENPGL